MGAVVLIRVQRPAKLRRGRGGRTEGRFPQPLNKHKEGPVAIKAEGRGRPAVCRPPHRPIAPPAPRAASPQEFVSVLGVLAREYPKQYGALHALAPSDSESSFFTNVWHVQVHRRKRALQEFHKHLEKHTMPQVRPPSGGPRARESLEGGGEGGLPPKHSGLGSTPKAFPYPNPSPNRISNRQ